MIRLTTYTPKTTEYYKTEYLKHFPNDPFFTCEAIELQILALKKEIIELSTSLTINRVAKANKSKQIQALQTIQNDRMVRFSSMNCGAVQAVTPPTNPTVTPTVTPTKEDWSEPITKVETTDNITTKPTTNDKSTIVPEVVKDIVPEVKESNKIYIIGALILVSAVIITYYVKKK